MKIFNNAELDQKIDDIYRMIKEGQEDEAWNCDSVTPVEVNFTWYDNGYDDDGEPLRGYAIDFGDYFTALYSSIDEAQEDFDLIQKKWAKEKVYIYYINSSDEQPSEHIDTLQGHGKNKQLLVNLAIHEIKRLVAFRNYDGLSQLLNQVPKKYLRKFQSEERQTKLGLS